MAGCLGIARYNGQPDLTTFEGTVITPKDNLPLHGGDIYSASERYGIPIEDWIDLSTGINPEPYPVQGVSDSAFHLLPYPLPALKEAASVYYHHPDPLAIAGTQAAIEVLPTCLPELPILLPEIGYQEHMQHWQKHDAEISFYPSMGHDQMCQAIDDAITDNPRQHLLVINPNNPTGVTIEPEVLQRWAKRLEGNLIVDEAFIDASPEVSVLPTHFEQNMVVLRSFGKFFGLAGLRIGFLLGNSGIRGAVAQRLNLWAVNGPAQHLAAKALADRQWQRAARVSMSRNQAYTLSLIMPFMSRYKARLLADHPLFMTFMMSVQAALDVNHQLAEQGILTRVVPVNESSSLLRFGTMSRHDLAISERVDAICRHLEVY